LVKDINLTQNKTLNLTLTLTLTLTAPPDFDMLQLVTSNDRDVKTLFADYLKNTSNIWQRRSFDRDFWCAGAYIVNKAKLRPKVDSIISNLSNGWTGMSIIAGYQSNPCFPFHCCKGRNRGTFSYEAPCFNAPRGFQSDHFLFHLTQDSTYMIKVPVITNAPSSFNSTVHQDHVSLHQPAFNRINTYVFSPSLSLSSLSLSLSLSLFLSLFFFFFVSLSRA
jgi:hypothetical protein